MDGTIALHETCSHSPHCPRALAHALREAALHVFNDCGGDVLALDVQAHAEPEDTLQKARALLPAQSEEAPAGADRRLWRHPSNVAQRLVEGRNARVVAG
jgi:PTS system ascorbate-specific IIA component